MILKTEQLKKKPGIFLQDATHLIGNSNGYNKLTSGKLKLLQNICGRDMFKTFQWSH